MEVNGITFSEIVDVYDNHGYDREVEVLGYDEDGNEYTSVGMESVGELVEIYEDTIELVSKVNPNVPVYYTYVMKKKDKFGIDVIKPMRTEWITDSDIDLDEDTMQEDEKLVFEEQFNPDEPEDIPNGWDVDTELNLDRDVPGNQND